MPQDQGPATGRTHECGKDPEQRRLAAPVRPQQSEDLPLADGHIEAAQDPAFAVVMNQSVDFDARRDAHRGRHHTPPPAAKLLTCPVPVAYKPAVAAGSGDPPALAAGASPSGGIPAPGEADSLDRLPESRLAPSPRIDTKFYVSLAGTGVALTRAHGPPFLLAPR